MYTYIHVNTYSSTYARDTSMVHDIYFHIWEGYHQGTRQLLYSNIWCVYLFINVKTHTHTHTHDFSLSLSLSLSFSHTHTHTHIPALSHTPTCAGLQAGHKIVQIGSFDASRTLSLSLYFSLSFTRAHTHTHEHIHTHMRNTGKGQGKCLFTVVSMWYTICDSICDSMMW